MLVLEVLELTAQRLVELPIARLAGLGTVLHIVAACTSLRRRLGACSAEGRVGRRTAGNGHAVKLRLFVVRERCGR